MKRSHGTEVHALEVHSFKLPTGSICNGVLRLTPCDGSHSIATCLVSPHPALHVVYVVVKGTGSPELKAGQLAL
jgi:hypothetical protein